ncbi:MAG: hypothetical protein AAF211_29080, partial [Myxococcota bacterium]
MSPSDEIDGTFAEHDGQLGDAARLDPYLHEASRHEPRILDPDLVVVRGRRGQDADPVSIGETPLRCS